MARYILSQFSWSIPVELESQVITPSKAIASYLKVPHYSLESLTQNMMRRCGWGLPSMLLSRRLVQDVLSEMIPAQAEGGAAQKFLNTIKDLMRSGVALQDLLTHVDGRIKQIAAVGLAYQQQLRRRQLIDPAELYWQAINKINYRKAYVFYGYFSPESGELAVVNAICGADSYWVLPTDDLYPQNQKSVDWLLSQGWELHSSSPAQKVGLGIQHAFKRVSTQGSISSLEISCHYFANLDAEVKGVLAQVKRLLVQGIRTQDIVLVAREEQLYGAALKNVAWECGLPLKVNYEISVEQTRLGAFLKLLVAAVEAQFPFEATAKLLAHPLVNLLSASQWSQARSLRLQGLKAWQGLGCDLSLLNADGFQGRDLWVKHLLEIFSSWQVLENCKSWAQEVVAYYRLQEGLSELRQLFNQKLSFPEFLREVSELVALLTISAQPGLGGIELHHPTAILGTSYQYVFALGCAEGIWPPAIADDPMLDFYLRRQLNLQGAQLTTAVERSCQETFEFYCLLNVPARSLIISYPEVVAGRATLPSSYLSRLGLRPQPLNDLPLISPEQARCLYLRRKSSLANSMDVDLEISRVEQAWQIEASRELAAQPDQYDGVIGINLAPEHKVFSASQLNQLGQCPFKWFSRRLLKLQSFLEGEATLGSAQRGTLYHLCLERSLAHIKTAQDLAQFNQEQLTQIFTNVETELGLTALSGWSEQRQEHLDLLSLNLATTEFLPPGREVIATETKFQTQWYGLQLQGQVDRIDRTSQGLMVLDYKTSSVAPPGVQNPQGKANLDLQLAIYQDAIAEQFPEESLDRAAYYSLTKQKILSRPVKDSAELEAFATQVKSHLRKGFFPVAPDLERKACSYCDYDLVCRQGDRLSRKSFAHRTISPESP